MIEEVCPQMAQPAIGRHENNEAIVLALVNAFEADADELVDFIRYTRAVEELNGCHQSLSSVVAQASLPVAADNRLEACSTIFVFYFELLSLLMLLVLQLLHLLQFHKV